MYENVIALIEYTVSGTSEKIATHLRKKEKFYKFASENKTLLLNKLKELDADFSTEIDSKYEYDEILIRYIYCSRYAFEPKHKDNALVEICFLDYPELRYFKSLTDGIRHSARSELLAFMDVPQAELGVDGKINSNPVHSVFPATLLPEANSNFESGYKIVSFYADAGSLLERAYVLRRQGWRDSDNLYQRMVSKAKITSIRKHLKSNGRVFVNNIIATLDANTKIVNGKGNTVDPKDLSKIAHVSLHCQQR